MPATRTLPSLAHSKDKSHHKGTPPTGFRNPWPSFPQKGIGMATFFKTRFNGNKPPYVPVPSDRAELVQVLRPDFSAPPTDTTTVKVTWIGHASFLVQCTVPGAARSLNILLDPVFSERTSPVMFFGPKRYTPTPCTVDELLDAIPIDVVCISHNHYDHADTSTLKTIYEHRGSDVVFCVALGNSRWLLPLGISTDQIWEADWWDQIEVSLSESSDTNGSGTSSVSSRSAQTKPGDCIRIVCLPCQHASARSPFDRDCDLWCSFAIQIPSTAAPINASTPDAKSYSSLYFSGDTGYRTIPIEPDPFPSSEIDSLPVCPAFAEIGKELGPFDLALLPIGLCRPRHVMSPVHCNPEDSICIHRDVKAKRSLGMHYGTVRGGLSQYYEDVRVPPREWREEAAKNNLKWREPGDESNNDWEIGLMHVGESISI